MNKKKIFLGIAALMMVCTLSVAGTLAYLTAQSNNGQGVTNTFVASGDGKLVETFELKEHKVTLNEDGTYTPGTDYLTAGEGNTYKVLPGIELPKDPAVLIKDKTEAPAYLYVEVVGSLDTNIFEWEIDSSWTELTGAAAPNGGRVYVYKDGEIIDDTTAGLDKIGIIAGDQVKVKAEADTSKIDENGVTLAFYGYMAQASAGDGAAAAFNACFGTAAP